PKRESWVRNPPCRSEQHLAWRGFEGAGPPAHSDGGELSGGRPIRIFGVFEQLPGTPAHRRHARERATAAVMEGAAGMEENGELACPGGPEQAHIGEPQSL